MITPYIKFIAKGPPLPGFMRGGGFLRDIATHTTSIPTIITTTVAHTGTMMFKSNHSGIPGNEPALAMSLPDDPVPNGGAIVPENEIEKSVNNHL